MRRNIGLKSLLCLLVLWLSDNANAAQHKTLGASNVSPLQVEEIVPGIFVAVGATELVNSDNHGHIANLGFIIGDNSVAVIDTGGSLFVGKRLRAAIESQTSLPIRYVINTHAHPDHFFGNAAFADIGAEFIAHDRFNNALAQRGPHYLTANELLVGTDNFSGTTLLPATQTVASELIVDLGNRTIRVIAHPTAHTDNDVIVVDESTKTAFLGDLLFMDHVPALDGSLKGWMTVMDKLAQQDFERVVPGHGPASAPWPEAMKPQIRYLQILISDLRRSIADGASINEASRLAGREERDAWSLFETFNTRNATTGFAELEWE